MVKEEKCHRTVGYQGNINIRCGIGDSEGIIRYCKDCSPKYVRICLSEKSREGGFLFYKPEAKGYTSDLSQAGLFHNNFTNQDVISIKKKDIENRCTIIRLVDFSEIQKLVSTTQLKQISKGLRR